jgi:3-oxoadipate enol-lactonase
MDQAADDGIRRPDLPPGRHLDVPGRGTTFVRELSGPAGAPTLLLLHGWTVTADLNWFTAYRRLAERYRIVALDHRGHGRGIRDAEPFTLEACADDAAAVCETLGIDRCVVVGYSMGGTIAQLVWHRHAGLVEGLVLCSTGAHFADTRNEQLNFLGLTGLAALVRLAPLRARQWMGEQYLTRRGRAYEAWALEELARHDLTKVLEAGREIGRFASDDWLGAIDVPTAVIVTMQDQVVPVRRQLRLFEGIGTAVAYRVDGQHDAVVSSAESYLPVLVEACGYVIDRARLRRSA